MLISHIFPKPNPIQRTYNPEDGHHNGIIFLSSSQPFLMAVDASRRLRMHRWYRGSSSDDYNKDHIYNLCLVQTDLFWLAPL